MKYVSVFVVGVLLLLTAVACQSGSLDAAPVELSDTVAVRDNKFDPRAIEVAPGTKVMWRFEGDSPHNVTGDGWASETQRAGGYERVFATAGTYDYKCTVHPGMTGRVIVR